MTRYIQFGSESEPILVEVSEAEVAPRSGVVKVGLKDMAEELGSSTVALAHSTFDQAVDRVLRPSAQAFIQSIRAITVPPSEVEIEFGLKITGELGNVAVGKFGGETNFNVKLTWKQSGADKKPDAT
jgi:hypothetical protein